MTSALREMLELIEESVHYIANRTMEGLEDPLDALALKTLINIRLQDLSKHKEIALTAGFLRSEEAAFIMNLETTLADSLAKCQLYLDSPERYREYAIDNRALKNRWKRRFTRIGLIGLVLGTACVGLIVLRKLQPAIQRLDL